MGKWGEKQRQRERKKGGREAKEERGIYFKELRAGQSEIYRTGQQAGNSGKSCWSLESEVCRVELRLEPPAEFLYHSLEADFLLHQETSVFAHQAFSRLDEFNPYY